MECYLMGALKPNKYRRFARLGIVAALLATMAIGCSSPGPQTCGPDPGIDAVWTEGDGAILGGSVKRAYNFQRAEASRQSIDGGWNWTMPPVIRGPHDFAVRQSIEAPRGTYEIRDSDIVLVTPDAPARITYSAAHLSSSANRWIQWQATESLGDREITTHPYALVYDDHHDTVVAAMGLQGVRVGTPDGDWRPVAVGPYSPTDFYVATRFGLLFSHPNLWISVVAVSVSVVAGTVALRRFRAEGGGRHQTPAFVFSAGVLTLSPVGMGIGSLLVVVVTGMVVSIYRFVAHRGTIRRFWEVVVLVIWTTLGSGLFVAILVYGFPVFIYAIFGFGVYFCWWYAVAVAATTCAAMGLLWLWLGSRFWLALALSWPMFRHWPVIIVAFLSINAVILGGVTLWMWNNVTLLPFQPLASGLTALIAWALWRYLRAKQLPQLNDEPAFPMVGE